jgi:Tol biopolymer transport system component
MQSDGSNQELILAEEDVIYERPVWSPDCRYIAYNVYRPDEFVTWEINIIDYENRDKGSLTVSYGRYQSWLPEGHTLIYNRPFEDDTLPSFIQLGLDDCTLDFESNKHDCMQFSKFYSDTGVPVQGLQPVVSPNGKHLAFTTHVMTTTDGRYYQHIRGYDLERGGRVYDITTSDGLPTDWFPWWGPDGDLLTVYFQSWRREKTNIWRVNLDGSGMMPIGPKDRININVSQGLMFVPSNGR